MSLFGNFFGSLKKKEPPPVTVDPNPIEGFVVVQNHSGASHSLYPDINNSIGNPSRHSSLPYSPSPTIPSGTAGTGSSNVGNTHPLGSGVNEIVNQLESVPFRLAPLLQNNTSESVNNNSINEFSERLEKLKRSLQNGDFNYDFKLERNILREAKLMNGHTAY